MWKFLLMLVWVLDITAMQESSSSKDCGIPKIDKQTRMIGAEKSFVGQWPWMAYIKVIGRGSGECGGSLIGPRHILTAAHCVDDNQILFTHKFKPADPRRISVSLGNHNITKVEKWHRVAEVRIHPGFNASESDDSFEVYNDIAVLILDQDVQRSDHVIPICLPEDHSEDTFESWNATAAGWGHTKLYGPSSDVLKWANLTVWENDECQEVHKEIRINENQICAGGVTNQGRNICNGDSGGPLMVQNEEKWMVIGITSNGDPTCGTEGHPSVFTLVTKYLDWIKNQIR